jgi:hypothetical protein
MNEDQIVWKRCSEGWWDAMRARHYAGWSVARQCRVRFVRNRPQQYDHGWYVFNDEIDQMIGPFNTSRAAKHACPLATQTRIPEKES